LSLPNTFAGLGIDRDQAAVERSDINEALIERNAAIHYIAAHELCVIFRNVRIVRPEHLACPRIERVNHAPRARRVKHAVLDE